MKKLVIAACVLSLSGCTTLTPTQKKVVIGVGSAIAIGMIAAHSSSGMSNAQITATHEAGGGFVVPSKPNCAANPASCQ